MRQVWMGAVSRPTSFVRTVTVVLLTASCGGDNGTTGPGGTEVAEVTVTPPTFSVGVGASVQLQASATDAAGGAVEVPITWSTSNAAVATVSSTGLVTGVAVGAASVAAAAGGQSANSAGQVTAVAGGAFDFVEVATLQGPADGIASVALSPDGQTLAYGNFSDDLIHLVDVTTRQETGTLAGHSAAVTDLVFSPNGQTLASTGTVNLGPADGSVRLWDVASRTEIGRVDTDGTNQLRFDPAGTVLAGASGGASVELRLWAVPSLTLQRTIAGRFNHVAFDPQGGRVAVGARDDLLHIHDVGTGAEVMSLSGHDGWVEVAAFSPDGTTLLSGGDDNLLRLWSATTGAGQGVLTGHASFPDFIAFSPDGARVVSLGSGIRVTRNGNQISISFSSADKVLRLWEVGTGTQLRIIATAAGSVSAVAINDDWQHMVTGNDTGVITFLVRN